MVQELFVFKKVIEKTCSKVDDDVISILMKCNDSIIK